MKKLISLILAILFVLIFNGTVSAQENIKQEKNVVVDKETTINEDYFATGDTITIAGVVNGDVYIAGGRINVEGEINGDLIAAGGTVNIRGRVSDDVRVAGGEVVVSGEVGKNITVMGGSINVTDSANINGSLVSGSGNLTVNGPVGKGITAGAGSLTLGNSVGGNIVAGVGELTLTPSATINGNLTYWSENEAKTESGAQINGVLKRNQPKPTEAKNAAKGFAGFSVFMTIVSFFSSLIIGVLLIRFLPVYTFTVAKQVSGSFLKSLGMGFLTLILTPLMIIILLVTIIGIPLALITLVVFLIDLYLAKIFVLLPLGQKVLSALNPKAKSPGWGLFVGLLVYSIVTLIPVFGWIVSFLVLLVGLGAIISGKLTHYNLLRAKKVA